MTQPANLSVQGKGESRVDAGSGFRQARTAGAFTLVEMLVVMAIVGILLALVVPAATSLNNSGNVNRAVNGISLVLGQARSYAMAHNTYVWVGFAPDPTTQKLTVGVVAGGTGELDDLSSVSTYFPINKVQTFEHFSLKTINNLPGMVANGDDIATSAVGSFQQTVAGTVIDFSEILQFSPQGEATINPTGSTAHWIQIGLQPMRGANADSANVAVFQVASLTGQVQVFRQ